MSGRSSLTCVIALVMCALGATAARAGGPPWATIRANSAHTNSSPGPDPRPPLTLHWSRKFGFQVDPLLVVDGLVVARFYDQSAGTWHLVALEQRTGATRWEITFGNHGLMPNAAFGDGRIYVLLVAGAEFELGAYDPADGHQLWRENIGCCGDREVFPVAVDDAVYVGGATAYDGATGARK